MPVASLSVYFYHFNKIVVRLPRCSTVFTVFSMGSILFGYVRSSFFNCFGKNGKFRIPCCMLSFVLLRCRNRRPIKGFLRVVMTTIFSLNQMSPNSNCISNVPIGASNCPLAIIIRNSGGEPLPIIVCAASN